MSDTNPKPTLAAGMAKHAFWIAIPAAALGPVYRMESLTPLIRSIALLSDVGLCLIAIVFALVALIRINEQDWKVVLVPGLAALIIGVYANISLTQWARNDWAQARREAAAIQNNSPAPRIQTVTVPVNPPSIVRARSRSIVKYELPALESIPSAVSRIRTDAASLSGEDAAMQRAWAAHLERFHAAYTNTLAASDTFHKYNLLDPSLISDFEDNNATRRRKLANQYSDAWRAFDNSVSTFPGSFYEDMRNERISPDRSGIEFEALRSFLDETEIAARLASLKNLCKAEQDVGLHYNYTATAVFDYARMVKNSPTISSTYETRMNEQIRKLREIEATAAAARREANLK